MATRKRRRSSANRSTARAGGPLPRVSVGGQGDAGIRYASTPSDAALKALHAAGFKYYRAAGWFAPPSAKALALAKRLAPKFDLG